MQTGEVDYQKETYPAVVVTMEPEAKAVKQAFENFMKDEYDVHLRGIGFLANKDVISAEEVTIPRISDKAMDFHAKIIEENGMTKMYVFGALGYDVSVSKANDNTDFQAMKQIVNKFTKSYLPDYYQQKLDKVDEKISSLQDEEKDYKGNLEDNQKEIEDLRKENKELREKLEETQTALQKALEERTKQREELEAIKSKVNNNR